MQGSGGDSSVAANLKVPNPGKGLMLQTGTLSRAFHPSLMSLARATVLTSGGGGGGASDEGGHVPLFQVGGGGDLQCNQIFSGNFWVGIFWACARA